MTKQILAGPVQLDTIGTLEHLARSNQLAAGIQMFIPIPDQAKHLGAVEASGLVSRDPVTRLMLMELPYTGVTLATFLLHPILLHHGITNELPSCHPVAPLVDLQTVGVPKVLPTPHTGTLIRGDIPMFLGDVLPEPLGGGEGPAAKSTLPVPINNSLQNMLGILSIKFLTGIPAMPGQNLLL